MSLGFPRTLLSKNLEFIIYNRYIDYVCQIYYLNNTSIHEAKTWIEYTVLQIRNVCRYCILLCFHSFPKSKLLASP